MKQTRILLLLTFLTSCSKNKTYDDLDKISFHRGYECWEKHLNIEGMPYNLEEIINGIRAAEKKELSKISVEEADRLTELYEEVVFNNQLSSNLKQAEDFLAGISKESIEIVPDKLYYKIKKEGNGKTIDPNSQNFFSYTAQTIHQGQLEIFNDSGDLPIEISIPDTIPGFAIGVVGMREGEERVLYIHPELAYGTSGVRMKPNQLVVLEVKAASNQLP